MWNQAYDPLNSAVLSTLLAALPLVILLGLLARHGVRAHYAALLGLAAALAVAIVVQGMPAGMAVRAAAFGAAYGFFPIVLNTIAGLAGVDQRYLNAARSMGVSGAGLFRHVLFPAAFPVILTGLRIGFFICFASVLGGETISSISGVGRNIALAAELMEPARMYAWILFVILAALALNALVSAFENRMRGH